MNEKFNHNFTKRNLQKNDIKERDINNEEINQNSNVESDLEKISKEVVKYILESSLVPIDQIAIDLGISLDILKPIIRKYFTPQEINKKWPIKSRKLSKEEEIQLIQMLFGEFPQTFTKIEKRFGLSHGTVRRYASKYFTNKEIRQIWPLGGHKISKVKEFQLKRKLFKDPPNSLSKISKDLKVDRQTVTLRAKRYFTSQDFNKKWSQYLSKEMEKKILIRLKEELKKERPASISALEKELKASSQAIIRLAKKHLTPKVYYDNWRRTIPVKLENKIIDRLKQEIKKDISDSFKKIAENFDVVSTTIASIAKKHFSEEICFKKWNIVIPKRTKSKIIRRLKEEVKKEIPASLSEIAREFSVNKRTIIRIGIKNIPKNNYEMTWPAKEKISEDIKDKIRNDILNTTLTINDIAEKYDVSTSPIRIISIKELQEAIIDYSHVKRFPYDFSPLLGKVLHSIIQNSVTEHFQVNMNIIFFTEILNPITGYRIDGLLLNKDNFFQNQLLKSKRSNQIAKQLGMRADQSEHIKAIIFDFTSDISDTNIIEKCIKYQHPKMLFFIVGTRWFKWNDIKKLPINKKILFPKNIRIISHELFANLIGLKGKIKENFNDAIYYNYNFDLDSLNRMVNLLENEVYENEAFKKDLKKYYGKTVKKFFL